MQVFQTVTAVAFCMFAGGAMAQDRVYDVEGFERVVITDGVVAEIVVGPTFAVSAEAVRGNIDRLQITTRGDSLVVSRDQPWGLFAQGNDDRFAVQITLPVLAQVENRSGASTAITGPTKALTRIDVSSGAAVDVRDADLANVQIDVSSGSTLRIAGKCDTIDAEASSGSTLRAADLICETADLRGSSGSSLDAHATQTARAHGSSGASIRLFGGAELVDQRASSGSSIDIN